MTKEANDPALESEDSQRDVIRVLVADDVIDDGDMHLRRALPHPAQVAVGPFVFLDHYRHHSLRGIGDRPHPHAGIEVVSYLLEGGVEHRDSMGNRDRLGAGDAQFIRAGRGMLHAEQPLAGRHGLQLWLNLPPELRKAEPTYTSVRATQLPEERTIDSRLLVLAGAVGGLHGPMALSGGAVFAMLRSDRNASVDITCDAAELALYVLRGHAQVGDTLLQAGTLGILGRGARLTVTAGQGDVLEAALIGGDPTPGKILFSGPFVMDTPEGLEQARRDYVMGRMGRLDGVPF